MSKEVKRFTLEARGHCDCGNPGSVQMVEQKRGRFVCYSHVRELVAERDALLAERDRMAALLTEERMVSSGMVDLYRDSCEERDALKKDAERYRFLMRELGGSVSQVVMGSPVFSNEDVDAAIDAALQGEQP